MNTVFQDYALFPHMTVQQNVEYGLMVKKVKKGERRERARRGARDGPPGGYGARKPSQLSGGQRQRVALARAIVNRPKVLLLDEPLGALDLKLRQQMQIELKSIQREVGITFVYVTHDQEEALTMSDRIAVFNEGRIEQVGPPAEVYEHPESEFIAGFVGVSNVLERDGRRYTIRPEKIDVLVEGGSRRPGSHVEEGVVRDVQYVGPVTRYYVTLDRGGELQVLAQNLEEGSSEVLEAKGRRVARWSGDRSKSRSSTNQREERNEKEAHRGVGRARAARRGSQRGRRGLWRRERRASASCRRSQGLGTTPEEIQAAPGTRAKSISSIWPDYAQF